MLQGKISSQEELRAFRSIKILLNNHPKLLKILFCRDNRQLLSVSSIKIKRLKLSSSEKHLLQIALDFWCGNGGAKLNNVLYELDDENYQHLLSALIAWKQPLNQVIANEKPTSFIKTLPIKNRHLL